MFNPPALPHASLPPLISFIPYRCVDFITKRRPLFKWELHLPTMLSNPRNVRIVIPLQPVHPLPNTFTLYHPPIQRRIRLKAVKPLINGLISVIRPHPSKYHSRIFYGIHLSLI